MKNYTLILVSLLNISALFAQHTPVSASNNSLIESISESEMKAAYRTINTVANLNTGNYDVTHQTLNVTVDPAVQYIAGSVTTTFTATQDMASITFDLTNFLTVNSATINGTELNFTQNTEEVVITLPQTLSAGEEATIVVTYEGAPLASGLDSFVTSTHNGSPILWTLSEPYGAKDWWPCKQDLNDKIESIDVFITAPSQYVSVSNGLEQSAIDNGNGTKTTHFQHNYPIPAYLVAIAVTNYSVYTQTAGTAPNTFPIVNYVYPESLTSAQTQTQQTVPIMNFFEERFETYPFHTEKYGHAQCGFGGGMEHTTVSFMGGFNRELIAHELAHQWFGDKITCGSWQDIWLNEGFATYLTGLMIEHIDGNNNFALWKRNNVENITSLPYGSVYIPAADTLSVGRVFASRLTYNKGAMVLHMLRFKLGDEQFFEGVGNYLADPALAYGYAKTPDFIAHMETASGLDLTDFFADWIYGEGYPTYSITVNHGTANHAVVTINQTQTQGGASFYELPVPLRFMGTNGEVFDTVVDNTVNHQQFDVELPFAAFNNVIFNIKSDIISAGSSVTLSNKPFSLLNSISLYPNPAGNMLNISVPKGVDINQVAIYNALGQKVLQASNTTGINIASLANGIHFVTLVTNAGTTQLKFVKE
ncbi:T9SS type A sorting domain-containing protein [Flavobacterium sp. Sd200]|uniref:M1 family aminopeptidase n=1 Tax=Flavobacterium sp. Sd200 TaxID=2692211 RepID=UPI001370C41D|nr:M1 family aminopeptidase [Flavobacterium sp. Sd200]MXN93071.1 T9SS type A sorting domain-containing protein [Flavobacterium sp. Sd200]